VNRTPTVQHEYLQPLHENATGREHPVIGKYARRNQNPARRALTRYPLGCGGPPARDQPPPHQFSPAASLARRTLRCGAHPRCDTRWQWSSGAPTGGTRPAPAWTPTGTGRRPRRWRRPAGSTSASAIKAAGRSMEIRFMTGSCWSNVLTHRHLTTTLLEFASLVMTDVRLRKP